MSYGTLTIIVLKVALAAAASLDERSAASFVLCRSASHLRCLVSAVSFFVLTTTAWCRLIKSSEVGHFRQESDTMELCFDLPTPISVGTVPHIKELTAGLNHACRHPGHTDIIFYYILMIVLHIVYPVFA